MTVGNALYTVSTYARAHNAAMNSGFNDNTDTYLLISSKCIFKEIHLTILSFNPLKVCGLAHSFWETLSDPLYQVSPLNITDFKLQLADL